MTSHGTSQGTLMKKILALAVAALLAGCGSNDSTTATGGQCMKDTDCKGERICESGACVSPATAVVPGAQTGTDLRDMAPAEPDTPAVQAPATTVAAGPQPEWVTGFGQGNLEYFIDNQGVTLYVGCPTQDGSSEQPSTIKLLRSDSTDAEIESFQILVKGKSIDAPLEALSRVGVANFEYVYSALREADFAVVFNGRTVQFPLSNARTELPAVDSDEFACNRL